MRKGHIKLAGYPAVLLGFWLLSTAMLSGGAWFIQEWRYRDLAAHPSDDQGADRPVYVSSGQMQVVNGETNVYMTSDGYQDDTTTEERRWRETHPFQGQTGRRTATPSYSWGASSSPGHLPDIRPLQ
jgi:hypothetical protein